MSPKEQLISPQADWESSIRPVYRLFGTMPTECPPVISTHLARLHECQKILTVGIEWIAEKHEYIRNISDQLFRGLLHCDIILINGEPITYDFDPSELPYIETHQHKLETIPKSRKNFFFRFFETLQKAGLPFRDSFENTLNRLASFESIAADHDILRLIQMMSISAWGYSDNLLRLMDKGKLNKIFTDPYRTFHDFIKRDENGLIISGEQDATICDIQIYEGEVVVIQKKKYQSCIRTTQKPIASFTIEWKLKMPSKEHPFTGVIRLTDFCWAADVTPLEMEDYKEAFFDLPPLTPDA